MVRNGENSVTRCIGTSSWSYSSVKVAAAIHRSARPRRGAHAPRHRVLAVPHHRGFGESARSGRARDRGRRAPDHSTWSSNIGATSSSTTRRPEYRSGRVEALPGFRRAARHVSHDRRRHEPPRTRDGPPRRGAAGRGRGRALPVDHRPAPSPTSGATSTSGGTSSPGPGRT